MSTTPRLPPIPSAEQSDFASVTGHAAEVMSGFFELYAELWQFGVVTDELREMTRIRNARVTDCGY